MAEPARAGDPVPEAATGWRAELLLRFARAEDGVTRMVGRRHTGPLVVQRAFYPEPPEPPESPGVSVVPHVYVLHPPGGLVGGDRLRLEVTAEQAAHALLTTPAATKVYRSAGPPASQELCFDVAAGATLEWLPQETILHDGTHARLTTMVRLEEGAAFIGLETLCFGLPARGETFATGRCRQGFEIWRQGHPLFVERGRFDATDDVHTAAWGLAGARVNGFMVMAPGMAGPPVRRTVSPTAPLTAPQYVEGQDSKAADRERDRAALLSRLRVVAAEVNLPGRAGVTTVSDGQVWVCRYVGPSAERARLLFQRLWTLARPVLLGRAAVAPRIWAT